MDCDRDELISKLKKKPRFAEHEHHEYDAPSLVSLARSISKPIARFLEDSSDVPPSKEVLIIDSNFYESSSSSDSTVNIENSRDYIKNLVRHRLYKDLDRKLAESQVEGGCECGGNILESKNVKRKEDACDYYLGVVEFATLFVDEVIMKAKEILEYKLEKKLLSCPCVEEEEAMVWPTIGNFAIDIGIFKIKYYVNTFTFEENWRFTVKFLHSTLDALSHFYYYQVMFSIPTKYYPIPQVTASLYFRYEVSRVLPRTCPVTVIYNVEGNRTSFNVNDDVHFSEKMLVNVLEAKLNLIKTVDF